MKAFHKYVSVVMVVMGLTLFLFGCGSSKTTTNEQQTDNQTSTQAVTIKLAHESPETHIKGIWAEEFKKHVESASEGNIKVELYHHGQLYAKEQAALQAVTQGVIQMSISSTGYLSSLVPEFEIFDLPMMFPDLNVLYALEDSELGEELLQKLDAKGLKGLGYITNVPTELFTAEPVQTMEDLKGKKIRAHTALLEESMRALGASPITMAAEEMYTAMQQGVIDGMLTTTAYAAPNKLQVVAPHMTKVIISAVVYPIVINKNFWDSLTEQQQQIILEAIRKAVQHNRDNLEAKSNEYELTLQNGGLQIHQLQDSERALWMEKLKPIYDKTAQKLDGDLFNRVMKFVEGQ
ncbi:MAG: hypothetical protein BAA01_01550 [Bacillus thermozeamaize]|uniref:C4-dicarboxylate ABC transporter substrate-binding protein n=1 Tax=Bacillus thermozeamaize TaxID=230954 RepID=A0A1Y3PFD6_9BACI|nr:MAG: hypothetical protein BAA01_01550 [Bacillus thermozeamaize]